MKNKILCCLLFFGLLAGIVTAQKTFGVARETVRFSYPVAGTLAEFVENDTLFGPAFNQECSNQVTTLLSSNWGYITGMNEYLDVEKAQRITLGVGSNFVIQEVWGFFSIASEVNNGPLRAKIYTAGGDGAPGALVATSTDINVSDIATSTTAIVPTAFAFPSSPAVSGPEIFVSIDMADLYATEDTVALWMTQDSCGDGNDAYELWGDGSGWFAFDSPDSWQVEANLLIGVVVQFDPVVSASEPFASMNGLRIFPATPNPTADDIRVGYQLDEASKVQIELYSTDGHLLQTIHKGYQTPGKFSEIIRTNQLPAGSYVYGITTEKARLMNRFVVKR